MWRLLLSTQRWGEKFIQTVKQEENIQVVLSTYVFNSWDLPLLPLTFCSVISAGLNNKAGKTKGMQKLKKLATKTKTKVRTSYNNSFIHNLPNKVSDDEQFPCPTSYDQIGIRREIPLRISLNATFISHQEIPGLFELCRFPRTEERSGV